MAPNVLITAILKEVTEEQVKELCEGILGKFGTIESITWEEGWNSDLKNGKVLLDKPQAADMLYANLKDIQRKYQEVLGAGYGAKRVA